jgi:hypothetical protein
VNDKIAPVTFRSARPVDRKTRHPFTGEVLDAGVPVELEPIMPQMLAPQAAGPYGVVLAELKAKRDALNVAIAAIEGLL